MSPFSKKIKDSFKLMAVLCFLISCQNKGLQENKTGEIDSNNCSGEKLTNDPYAAGLGTEASPYEICTLAQLNNIRDNLTSYFIIKSNIDAQETSTWNGGAGWDPLGVYNESGSSSIFLGHIDGENHTISNLVINRPNEDGVGFISVQSCREDRIYIKDLKFTGISVTGRMSTGALIGSAWTEDCDEYPAIQNISIAGNVTGTTSVGGIVGLSDDGAGFTKYLGNLLTSNVNVTGTENVGGVIGKLYGSILTNSSSSGSITGDNYVGRLVGFTSGQYSETLYTKELTSTATTTCNTNCNTACSNESSVMMCGGFQAGGG